MPSGNEPAEWTPSVRWRARRWWRLARVAVPVALYVGFVLMIGHGVAPSATRWFPALFALLSAGVLAGLFVIFARYRGRRTALRTLADQRGWTLHSTGTAQPASSSGRPASSGPLASPGRGSMTGRWSWAPFAGRNSGSVVDLLTGEFAGRRFAEFTYSYADRGLGGGAALVGVTVVGLPAALPRLQVSPESVVTTLLPGLRWFDVDVESEAFNRRYRVQAEDRRYAVAVLNQRTVQTLLTVEPFTWRIDGSDLIAFGHPTADPGEILRRLELVTTLAANLPSLVFDDHRAGPAVPLPGGSPRRPSYSRRRWRRRRQRHNRWRATMITIVHRRNG